MTEQILTAEGLKTALEDAGILIPDYDGEIDELPNPTPVEAEASQLSPEGEV